MEKKAIAINIGIANVEVIDQINILNATYESMKMALKGLDVQPEVILVDAVTIPEVAIPQEPIIKGGK